MYPFEQVVEAILHPVEFVAADVAPQKEFLSCCPIAGACGEYHLHDPPDGLDESNRKERLWFCVFALPGLPQDNHNPFFRYSR